MAAIPRSPSRAGKCLSVRVGDPPSDERCDKWGFLVRASGAGGDAWVKLRDWRSGQSEPGTAPLQRVAYDVEIG